MLKKPMVYHLYKSSSKSSWKMAFMKNTVHGFQKVLCQNKTCLSISFSMIFWKNFCIIHVIYRTKTEEVYIRDWKCLNFFGKCAWEKNVSVGLTSKIETQHGRKACRNEHQLEQYLDLRENQSDQRQLTRRFSTRDKALM